MRNDIFRTIVGSGSRNLFAQYIRTNRHHVVFTL